MSEKIKMRSCFLLVAFLFFSACSSTLNNRHPAAQFRPCGGDSLSSVAKRIADCNTVLSTSTGSPVAVVVKQWSADNKSPLRYVKDTTAQGLYWSPLGAAHKRTREAVADCASLKEFGFKWRAPKIDEYARSFNVKVTFFSPAVNPNFLEVMPDSSGRWHHTDSWRYAYFAGPGPEPWTEDEKADTPIYTLCVSSGQ